MSDVCGVVGDGMVMFAQDLADCVHHLHAAGYSRPALTALWARSAGALTAAMFCNQWPQLLQAAILEVCV